MDNASARFITLIRQAVSKLLPLYMKGSEGSKFRPISPQDLADAAAGKLVKNNPQNLADAAAGNCGGKNMDPSSASLCKDEWDRYIRPRRRSPEYQAAPVGPYAAEHPDKQNRSGPCITIDGPDPPDDLTGLALSGGGIRSATFALGVLQCLAGHDVLRRFDYLSTVSGGGYIGASLTWLLSKDVSKQGGNIRKDKQRPEPLPPEKGLTLRPSGVKDVGPFPYGTDDPTEAPEPDRSRPEGAMLRYLRQHGNYLTPGGGITFTSGIVVLLRGLVLNLLVWIPIIAALVAVLVWFPPQKIDGLPPWVRGPLLELSPPTYPPPPESTDEAQPAVPGPGTSSPRAEERPLIAFGFTLGVAVLLFGISVLIFAFYSLATYGLHREEKALRGFKWLAGSTRYWARYQFERRMRWIVWSVAGLLVLSTVPWFANEFGEWITGPTFSLIGILSGIASFAKSMQPKPQRTERVGWSVPGTWLASVGAAFLLYGILLLSFAIGRWAAMGPPLAGVVEPFALLSAALVVAVLTGWFVDLNLITIHRFYRDRLMEAFLPDLGPALANKTALAYGADLAFLSGMCDEKHLIGPYHIINTNLVLTASNERTYRLRGGDSFILSPLYCGSNATGWLPTEDFMKGELTLPTAMAVSGAAANPWTASGGVGVTRSLLVGTLMALLNLRLGFWVPNPSRPRQWRFRPNHFYPGLFEVIGRGLKERSRVSLLSDGGHFENLGIYELVRRRLKLIVVCDGTADPNYDFTDLQTAMARVWTDFAARIEFDRKEGLGPFMPAHNAPYPTGAKISQSAYAIAKITYADRSEGHLVYLTTALIEGLRLQLMGYKGANWDFPDQPTGDQFFDEVQFEAYRELGYVIAEKAVGEIKELLRLLCLERERRLGLDQHDQDHARAPALSVSRTVPP